MLSITVKVVVIGSVVGTILFVVSKGTELFN